MISTIEKNRCCGCEACISKCPKQCIAMTLDDEGFYYPYVDQSKCVHCGLCERVCPVLNVVAHEEISNCMAVVNPNEDVRRKSSSGGVFIELALNTIQQGGVVFGAVFNENWDVEFVYAENEEGLIPMMGSKYVQARLNTAYKDAESFLKEGRLVLFTGSPCQISGLKCFLKGKDYPNLISVDFLCHGVPSPGVWKKHLSEISNGRIVEEIFFRNKDLGWKKPQIKLKYSDSNYINRFKNDLYLKGFLSDIYLRRSCYSCKLKNNHSKGDITIGDFWGLNQQYPDLDDDKGTSLVILNNEKGTSFFKMLNLKSVEISNYSFAKKFNGGFKNSISFDEQRRLKFYYYNKKTTVSQAVLKVITPSLTSRIIGKVKNIIRRYK